MTVVENVLIGGVEASFYTVFHHLAGSGWTLQLLDLARGQQRESNKAQFIKHTGKGHIRCGNPSGLGGSAFGNL